MSRSAELSRLVDFGDPVASEANLRERLGREADFEIALELRTLIARALGLQGRYEEALRLLDEVRSDLPSGSSAATIRVPLEEGRCFNDTNQAKEASKRFLEAYRLAEALDDEFLALDALHMLAIVGSPSSQIEWAGKALNRLDLVSDADAATWKGPILNNLGWSYFEKGEYETARRIFGDSVEFRSSGPVGPQLIAEYSVARCYRPLGRYEEGLLALDALIEKNRAIGRSAPYVEEELGEVLYVLGRMEEAKPHFAIAYAALSQDSCLAVSEPDRISRLYSLSQ